MTRVSNTTRADTESNKCSYSRNEPSSSVCKSSNRSPLNRWFLESVRQVAQGHGLLRILVRDLARSRPIMSSRAEKMHERCTRSLRPLKFTRQSVLHHFFP